MCDFCEEKVKKKKTRTKSAAPAGSIRDFVFPAQIHSTNCCCFVFGAHRFMMRIVRCSNTLLYRSSWSNWSAVQCLHQNSTDHSSSGREQVIFCVCYSKISFTEFLLPDFSFTLYLVHCAVAVCLKRFFFHHIRIHFISLCLVYWCECAARVSVHIACWSSEWKRQGEKQIINIQKTVFHFVQCHVFYWQVKFVFAFPFELCFDWYTKDKTIEKFNWKTQDNFW